MNQRKDLRSGVRSIPSSPILTTNLAFLSRQRYWLRSYLGYTPITKALPNTTHCALAALQYGSIIPNIITQVSLLSSPHLSRYNDSAERRWPTPQSPLTRQWQSRQNGKRHPRAPRNLARRSFCVLPTIYIETHLQRVRCKNGHLIDRTDFQKQLSVANPQWKQFLDDVERTGNQPRTNPDGDVRFSSFLAHWPVMNSIAGCN